MYTKMEKWIKEEEVDDFLEDVTANLYMHMLTTGQNVIMEKINEIEVSWRFCNNLHAT